MAAILSRGRWVKQVRGNSPWVFTVMLLWSTDRLKINSSPPRQNDRHFADDIFRCIFMIEKFSILIEISLKFVPMGPINNNQALV